MIDLVVRRPYHVRNNDVTYIGATLLELTSAISRRRMLCVATRSSVATMSSLAQLRVRDGYREAG